MRRKAARRRRPALAAYANRDNDYAISTLVLGNEPSLFDGYDVDRLNREWRAIALAMLRLRT